MAYKGHKAGSRKSVVHQAFDEGGEEAATLKAAELGLAAGTVRSWIAGWKRTPSTPQQSAQVRKEKATPVKSNGVAKVFDCRDPGVYGVIITRGAEVSEVKWDNGDKEYVVNDWLKPAPKGVS